MNKSSSLLLHLHLHLLHFLIMNKSSYFKKKNQFFINLSKKKKEKRKKRKFSKKALRQGALGSYFLGCFQKKKSSIKIFNSLKKFKTSKFFKNKKKKKICKIFNSFEKFKFSKFKKKKKIFIKFFFMNRKL